MSQLTGPEVKGGCLDAQAEWQKKKGEYLFSSRGREDDGPEMGTLGGNKDDTINQSG